VGRRWIVVDSFVLDFSFTRLIVEDMESIMLSSLWHLHVGSSTTCYRRCQTVRTLPSPPLRNRLPLRSESGRRREGEGEEEEDEKGSDSGRYSLPVSTVNSSSLSHSSFHRQALIIHSLPGGYMKRDREGKGMLVVP